MHNDEGPRRGAHGQNMRRPYTGHSYLNKNTTNYSPSTSYNYSPGSTGNAPQHIRRKGNNPNPNDRSKKELLAAADKMVRQNDTIIRLLKEINQRLRPADEPVASSTGASDASDAIKTSDDTEESKVNMAADPDADSESQDEADRNDDMDDMNDEQP